MIMEQMKDVQPKLNQKIFYLQKNIFGELKLLIIKSWHGHDKTRAVAVW